jgi:hypothetical protein
MCDVEIDSPRAHLNPGLVDGHLDVTDRVGREP